MRISDWSSDVCSSDLIAPTKEAPSSLAWLRLVLCRVVSLSDTTPPLPCGRTGGSVIGRMSAFSKRVPLRIARDRSAPRRLDQRSEEHTSELQSLMRSSYDVFCLKKKTQKISIYTQ